MVEEKTISTRGLKADACLFGELIFDVNSAYFHNHGGYEYAKQFYADAYQAAVDIVGGEQYILSAVMHADERNRAMSEALGQDVYHYHLHVVYVPVVEKQILWSKRRKDKSLVGTVKETVMQVSSSKEHLTVPQFKVMQEEKRLEGITEQIEQSGTELAAVQQQLTSGHAAIQQIESDTRKAEKAADAAEKKMTKAEQALRTQSMTFMKIDSMGKKTLTGNIALAPDEARELKELAKKGVTADSRLSQMEEKVARAQKDAGIWKRRYEKLFDQVQDYLTAVKKAPERVADFLRKIIQERDIPQRRRPTRTQQRSVER